MSHINGTGYGSSHDWIYRGTPYGGCTKYKCAKCNVDFSHHYNDTGNIFKAIEEEGVPDKCEAA